jgi:hypothetical protein
MKLKKDNIKQLSNQVFSNGLFISKDTSNKRLHGNNIPLVKSGLINNTEKSKANELLQRVEKGKHLPSRLLDNKNVLKECRRLLIEKGLTLEAILDEYSKILQGPRKEAKTSDIVKILENISKLHGLDINKPDSEIIPDTLRKSIQEGNVTTYIMAITSKTSSYLDKLNKLNKDNKVIKVQDAQVIGPTEEQAE